MAKEKINYNEFTLDPEKEVLVPMSTYLALTNVIQQVEKEHSTRIRSDKHSFFSRKTHKKLAHSTRAKMKPEKLEKEYYENIDLDATAKNIRIDRDELGSAAIQLLGEFRGIFEMNIDKGNCIKKPTENKPLVHTASVEGSKKLDTTEEVKPSAENES
jgi:hypothetical protein